MVMEHEVGQQGIGLMTLTNEPTGVLKEYRELKTSTMHTAEDSKQCKEFCLRLPRHSGR